MDDIVIPEVEWVHIQSEDDLPRKPGLESYEYVECLVFLNGEVKYHPWNCEHRCWDDEEHDDFHCDALTPSHYAVVSYATAVALSRADMLGLVPSPRVAADPA